MTREGTIAAPPERRGPDVEQAEEPQAPRGTSTRLPARLIARRISIAALALLLAAVLAAGVHAWRSAPAGPDGGAAVGEAAAEARLVKTVEVPPGRSVVERSFPGVTRASRETRLAFRVSGPIDRFDVKVGQRVAKGALLARIDPRDFELAVARVEAGLVEARAGLKAMRAGARDEDVQALEAKLEGARAQRDEARRIYDRVKALYEEKAAARAQYEAAMAGAEVAEAAVRAVEQELEKATSGARVEEIEGMEAKIAMLQTQRGAAENALADTRLLAPFDGYVAQKFAETHETVAAGQPIVTLLQCETIEVTVGVPEDVLVQQDRFRRFQVELDAYPGQRYEAELYEVGPAIQLGKLSYPLTVRIAAPEDCIVRPGMTATVRIVQDAAGAEAEVALPLAATLRDADGSCHVWVVDAATSRVRKRAVTVGELGSGGVEIRSGLSPGERVVSAGASFLHDGQRGRLGETAGQRSGGRPAAKGQGGG